MDNYRVDVTGEGDEKFRVLFEELFERSKHGKTTATHFEITKTHGLVFFWGPGDPIPDAPRAQLLPFPTGATLACTIALDWLKIVDYGKQPDHDGSNGKGWRIYNEEWGHVGGSHYAIVAVKPAWAMYGK